jgi:transcriptional regulator with PAS, ATPase and Fis domain
MRIPELKMRIFLILTNPRFWSTVGQNPSPLPQGESDMSDLSFHQNTLQALSELIQFSLGVEVFFVDGQRVAIAGTGPYRTKVGTRRPTDSYVDVTIKEAESPIVTEPRYTEQCYRCEYRGLCPYSMVMCRPIVTGKQIKGMMGFLAFSKEQRQAMIERSSLLSELCRRSHYIWHAEGLDVRQFLTHPETNVLINAVDVGLILTSPDYHVLNINQKAERLLRIERGLRETPGHLQLDELVGHGKSVRPGVGRKDASSLRELGRRDFPISDGQRLAGHLIVVADRARRSQTWKGCVLATRHLPRIVGTSQAIIRLKEQASFVAESDSTVLILGETGVGKEVVARYVHEASRRCAGPFETVNCAAIPDSLFESELFGYVPGAFTGASKKGKPGKFLLADGGTVFLDEVGRLSPENQAKILRILEQGELQRLGGARKETVNVRVLAATNINLEQAVEENRFGKDLYYRLAVIPLTVPPLRERVEDVPLLIEHFVGELRKVLLSCHFRGFSSQALDYLMSYDWPGNVRELRNTVEYVMNVVRGRDVTIQDLPPTILTRTTTISPYCGPRRPILPLAEIERRHIRLALQTFGETTEGKRKAAQHLGISVSTLYRKIAQQKEMEQRNSRHPIGGGEDHHEGFTSSVTAR